MMGAVFSGPAGGESVTLSRMSDRPDNLILRMLRRMDEKLDRIGEDMRELKGRAGPLEERYASVSRRLDNVELRLERIERRLELSDASI